MANKDQKLEHSLAEFPVIAILRGVPEDTLLPLARVLVENGIKALEVTLDTPGAEAQIAALRRELKDCALGAGTVLSEAAAWSALRAGAEFLITPTVVPGAARAARLAGVPLVMGATTPTEIMRAWELGASMVKLFPAGALGLDYFRQIREPLSAVPLVPTGGVGPQNAAAFLKAGAYALGIGGYFYKRGTTFDPEAVRERVLALRQAIDAA